MDLLGHGRQGINVARWIEKKLKDRNHVVFFINPLELDLPLLDSMYKEITNPSERIIDLRNKINEAEGYIPVTPEYNHSTSSALKNTLDYFLEEYYFKPSANCFLFPWNVGGVNAAQQLRLIFAELGVSSIPSSFVVPMVHKVFDQNDNLLDDTYDKRIIKFLEEFEWYIESLKNQRAKGTPY